MFLALVVVVMLLHLPLATIWYLEDIGSSTEIDGRMCCAEFVSMTHFGGFIETAVPVRNSGNGTWGAAKISQL